MLRRCVRSRNIVNEEAMAHWGLLRQKKWSLLLKIFAALTERESSTDILNSNSQTIHSIRCTNNSVLSDLKNVMFCRDCNVLLTVHLSTL